MKLIIGLGNPGKEYEKTRHNIGFLIVDAILEKFKFEKFKEEKKFKSLISLGEINKEKTILAKPLTFMNLSGIAIKEIINFYKIKLSDIIVIQDDKDMDFLKIRIKKTASGDGGHNGIKSILKETGTKDIKRFKIGIKNNLLEKIPTDKFVLSNFSKEEINQIKEQSDTIIENIIKQ